MKQFTIEEYTKIYGFDFYVLDETIDDYCFGDGEQINPEHSDWERLKDEIIVEVDDFINCEKPTLVIATFVEEEEEERELTDEEIEAILEEKEFEAERDEKCLKRLFGE